MPNETSINHNGGKQVIFGTGPLGLSVMDALLRRGYNNVTLVNRSGHAGELLPAGVTLVQGDATDPDDVARIAADAAVVFQCAQPEYHEWPEKFPPIVRGILDGVSRADAKLIAGDNLYMYGPTHGKPITEDLPYAATGPKGRTRAEMAQLLLDAHKAGKARVAIGRGSDFYGPRVEGSVMGDIVFEAAVKGETINLMGDIDLPHTYTYIADFGEALVTLAEHDEALGRPWHVPNAETTTTRQFVDLIGQELGRPLKVRTAGSLMITLMGLFNPTLREFKELAYEFTEPYVVDSSKFQEAFGANPAPTAHRQGIGETVAWYRNR